jgi:hypothetical protein|tara:strand:+ start:49 stop:723 length:675 start_codon:yes stop_codon:yes gene_type:complete
MNIEKIITRTNFASLLDLTEQEIFKMEKEHKITKSFTIPELGRTKVYWRDEALILKKEIKKQSRLSSNQRKTDLKCLIYGDSSLSNQSYFISNRSNGAFITNPELILKLPVNCFLYKKKDLQSFDDIRPNMDTLIKCAYKGDKKYVPVNRVTPEKLIEYANDLLNAEFSGSSKKNKRTRGGIKRTLDQWRGFFKWFYEDSIDLTPFNVTHLDTLIKHFAQGEIK